MTYRAGMLAWTGGGSSGSSAWDDITGKPSTFSPSAHSHAISDVTGLQTALDGKQASGVVASLMFHSDAGANLTLTNQVAGEQGLANTARNEAYFDAAGFVQVRLCASIVTASASTASPRLYVQYHNGSAWTTVGTGSGTQAVSMATPTGAKRSDWLDIPAGAKADVRWRVAQIGGDGAADPALGNISLQFR